MNSRFDYWASDSTYEYTLDRARECYDTGQYADALILYRQLMANGVDSDTYFEAGCCYHKLTDYPHAATLFEKSLQLNNRRWSAYIRLADCYYQLKDCKKAIHNGMQGRTLRPDDLLELLNLAKYYDANNMGFKSMYYKNRALQSITDKRDENYRKISREITEGRNESNRYSNSAYSSLQRKELVPAHTSYLQALKTYPISYETNYNLALVCKDLNKPNLAIKYLMRALFLDSREKRIYKVIASEYSKLRDYTRAYCFVKRYLNSLISNPNQAEYLNTMRNLKALESHIDKNFTPNIDFHIESNQYIEAFYEAENALILSNTTENKKRFQEHELLLFPESSLSKLYNKTGLELYNSGKYKEADKFFTRVMEIAKKDSEEYKFAKARASGG